MFGDNEHTPDGGVARFPRGREPVGPIVIKERLGGAYPAKEWYGGGGEASEENAFDFARYWQILLKHWLLLVAGLIVALGLGIANILLTQPTYRAAVTIQIDKETQRVMRSDALDMRAERIGSEEFFTTQYGLLTSRSLAEQTINSLNLQRDPVMLAALNLSAPKAGEDPASRRRAITGRFQGALSVTPVRGSRLVNVAFDSASPAVSARIANAVAENFIASNLMRRLDATADARKFLEEQLAKEKQKLEASDRQLAAYATQQQIINIPGPADKSGSSSANQSLMASSLMAETASLTQARADRVRAEARWREAMASSGADLPEVLQSDTIRALKEAISKLEGEYQEKAKTFRPEYPEMQQLRRRITDAQDQIAAETRNIRNSLKISYEVALNQERQFEGNVNRLKSGVLDLRGRSIKYDILQREVDTSRELYDSLLQNYKEVGVAGNLVANNISVIDWAEPPASPSKPEPLKIMLIAAVAGLIMGIGLVFLVEALDDAIHAPEEVERKLGLPLLGVIPKLEKGQVPMTMLADARSSFAEAYFSLRTALQFSTSDGVPSSLLITSSRPSEGKSTSAVAVAQNFARMGLKVLLVDSDLRNPSLHRVLSADNSAGFSNYLTGHGRISSVTQASTTPLLDFIPCGPLPPSPAELLAGPRLRQMLHDAREHYDMVVIDGPPVMGLADAPLLSSLVGGTLLVIESATTGRRMAKLSIHRLSVGNARVIGVLLSKFDARKSYYGYGYGYDYNYGTRPVIEGDG